jgi:acyl-homoserine lactone acylase PvdQ
VLARDWVRRGIKEYQEGVDNRFSRFAVAVKRAMARAEAEDVENIKRHAAREWTASAWRLERKFPDRWGKRDQLSVKTDLTVHIQVRSALPSAVFGALAGRGEGEIVDVESSESPELPAELE